MVTTIYKCNAGQTNGKIYHFLTWYCGEEIFKNCLKIVKDSKDNESIEDSNRKKIVKKITWKKTEYKGILIDVPIFVFVKREYSARQTLYCESAIADLREFENAAKEIYGCEISIS